jgi:hypothetical protein
MLVGGSDEPPVVEVNVNERRFDAELGALIVVDDDEDES